MILYVNSNSFFPGNGSAELPFQTISEAAAIALPGDIIQVARGIYRENVNPVHGGTCDERISYIAEEKGTAVITGAEPIKNWKQLDKHVWEARIFNGIFGDSNPYTTLVEGDWFNASYVAHTGEVYLNDKAMYEVLTEEEVRFPHPSETSRDKDFSVYTWYTKQDSVTNETIILANFQGSDPNKENVEINVRSSCFYPSEEGRNFITVSGFKICKAASQWAPPTAYQTGMIGPHWSKGWIIEDCEICDSKCSGISLGKYLQTDNNNKWSIRKYKDGTQTERDCICQAAREGWSKERIGSHIIRRCNIHDCGQTGIVGHLGGVFSIIEDNHIHHINHRQNLCGAEIGGIKMHAAIDCIIRRNHIHDCTRGIWLDWQAQGTRVSQNFFHDNTLAYDFPQSEEVLDGIGEDLFVEVSHGPTTIDNNILLSERALRITSQGVAVIHNLIAGSLVAIGRGTDNGAVTLPSPRYTPYHVPHETGIAGFMTILHGDCRFYNNIFVKQQWRPNIADLAARMKGQEVSFDDWNFDCGTYVYDDYPTFQEWSGEFEGYCGLGSPDSDRYYMHLPVWISHNIYLGGSVPYKKEKDFVTDLRTPYFSISEESGEWYLKTDLYSMIPEFPGGIISTQTLGEAFEPEEKFESPDGSSITFNQDYFGKHRPAAPICGPFSDPGDLKFPLFKEH